MCVRLAKHKTLFVYFGSLSLLVYVSHFCWRTQIKKAQTLFLHFCLPILIFFRAPKQKCENNLFIAPTRTNICRYIMTKSKQQLILAPFLLLCFLVFVLCHWITNCRSAEWNYMYVCRFISDVFENQLREFIQIAIKKWKGCFVFLLIPQTPVAGFWASVRTPAKFFVVILQLLTVHAALCRNCCCVCTSHYAHWIWIKVH